MNLLTKEECMKALDCLADDDKMDELAQKFSMDDDYTSYVNYEMARKWCYDQLKQCIDEHFDNPPLKWEELKEGMFVWDKNIKSWIEIDKTYEDIEQYVSCWSIGWPYEKRFPYEPNRFYRKEVVQE